MMVDSRSFRQDIGLIDGRRATMHIGGRRVLGNMLFLDVISCVSLEKLAADEATLWFGYIPNDKEPHIIVVASTHTTSILDDGPGMIDDEIIAHYEWWKAAIAAYAASDADETHRHIREQALLDKQLEEAIERVRTRFEWRGDEFDMGKVHT